MAKRISFTFDRNAGTMTFRKGQGYFSIPVVQAHEDETLRLTQKSDVRQNARGSFVEFCEHVDRTMSGLE